jgi:hypothetical protein
MRDRLGEPVSRFQAVSKWRETNKILIINGNHAAVSRFHDFPGRLLEILILKLLWPSYITVTSKIEDRCRLILQALGGPRSNTAEVVAACKRQNILANHLVIQVDLLLRFKTRWVAVPGKINALAYPKNHETVKQSSVFKTKSAGCRFRAPLKPLETVKQPAPQTLIDEQIQGVAGA